MATVAFIGLGNMGAGMAAHLLDAGHTVRVYNRTAARAAALVARGARRSDTPAGACLGADVVMSMVADDAASRAVWLGRDGILTHPLAAGTLAIECSTLSYDWVMELAGHAARSGLRYIDAPVTGLPEAAAAGELTLLVGAESADLTAAAKVLEAIATRIVRFGAVGTGTAYKLIVNMLGAVQIASAAEAMAIAERVGLDPRLVADTIATGQAASPQVVRNCRRMVDGDHARAVIFTPQLRLKDVSYGLRLARRFGIGSPFAALAGAAFATLCDLGHASDNESAIVEVARSQKPATI